MPRERPGLVQETHTDAGPPARLLLTSAFPACSTARSCSRKPWSTSPSRSSSSLSSSLLSSSSLSESSLPLSSPSSELSSCGWAARHASPPLTACPPAPPPLAGTNLHIPQQLPLRGVCNHHVVVLILALLGV